jgi:hypothetical protein
MVRVAEPQISFIPRLKQRLKPENYYFLLFIPDVGTNSLEFYILMSHGLSLALWCDVVRFGKDQSL